MRANDLEPLMQRRNDEDVARLQSWALPFTREQAERLIAEVIEMTGPADGEWWMATIADPDDTTVFGDLALHLGWGGRAAEVGYTLHTPHWGRGYATEAVDLVLDWLLDAYPITRIFATLHPDNVASARVLERCGFTFEAHTRNSYWVGDENSDDYIYAMAPDERRAWLNRATVGPEHVELVELDYESSLDVWRLRTHKSQERFVSPMPESFADALFPEPVDGAPLRPWLRGVRADADFVGFVMLAVPSEHHPHPYLWRLLIDRMHQRRGIGSRVLDLVVAECRSLGSDRLITSWGEGPGSPRPFYERYGFVTTGRIVDGETEASLAL
jgi:RimJ/RimL family protein N-acetyltransferase